MKAAVTKNGMALKFASEELRADPEIVAAAVAENGRALEFSSEKTKDDREVVLAAFRSPGISLTTATELLDWREKRDLTDEFLADREFVAAVVAKEGRVLEQVSTELQADPARSWPPQSPTEARRSSSPQKSSGPTLSCKCSPPRMATETAGRRRDRVFSQVNTFILFLYLNW